jgi:hypothetical protein
MIGWILESFPNWVFSVMGAASGLAFLAGPLALVMLAPRRWAGGLQQFHARLPAATLLSLLSVTAASVTGTASLVHVFRRIAETGSGGAGVVAEAGVAAAQPLLYGVVTIAACLLGVAALTLRRGGSGYPTTTAEGGPMSPFLAVGLSALLGLAIVGVDGLLRLHHELMNVTITLIDPAKRADAVTAGIAGSVWAAIAERNSSVLIVGGGLLTLALLVAGLGTWRASRARRPHRLLVWTSTVALVVVVVGAAWHARLLSASLESYRDVIGRAAVAMSPRL